MELNSLVEVRWLDIRHESEDCIRTEAINFNPVEFSSYGVLLCDNETKVSVAGTSFLEDEGEHKGEIGYRDVVTIPRGCVVRIIKLEEVS